MAIFRPANQIRDKIGVFVALTGTANAGKTFSALSLARGIAGPGGRIAVADTEGGRTLNLKDQFEFDAVVMSPPFRPQAFSDIAIAAEQEGYACLVIDSFSQEWTGMGGVLSWQEEELSRMAGDDWKKREACKFASWIKPKTGHKAMVNSLLQRRIPIVFSIRGEESVKPAEKGAASRDPVKVYKSLTDKSLPFEMSIAFRLDPARKGYIDLSDPTTWKMEGAHREIFRDGDRLSAEHGAKLAAWASGLGAAAPHTAPSRNLADEGDAAAERGSDALASFWGRLTAKEKHAAGGANALAAWKAIAAEADKQIAAEEEHANG
jgi:hypothetical protein